VPLIVALRWPPRRVRWMVLAPASASVCAGCGGSGRGAVTLNWYVFPEPSGSFAKAAAACSSDSSGRYGPSTGTKDPASSDVLYVERLIAPAVVNTMPEKTLHAFADHGDVERALDTDLSETERTLDEAEAAGIDRRRITEELEREGVKSFCDSYHELLDCIDSKLASVGGHDQHDLGQD
jgi:hypothetical protein